MSNKMQWCLPESCIFCYFEEWANFPTCKIRRKRFGRFDKMGETIYGGLCNVTTFDKYKYISSFIEKAQRQADFWKRIRDSLPEAHPEEPYVNAWIAHSKKHDLTFISTTPEGLISRFTFRDKKRENLIKTLKKMYLGQIYDYFDLWYNNELIEFYIAYSPIAKSLATGDPLDSLNKTEQ